MLKYSTWTEITVWGQELLNLNQASFAVRENALLTAAGVCALPTRQLWQMLLQLMPPLFFKMSLFPVPPVITTKNEAWALFVKPMQTVVQTVLENNYFHQSSKQLLCFQRLGRRAPKWRKDLQWDYTTLHWNFFNFYGSLKWSQRCEIPFPFSMMQTHRVSKSPSHAVIVAGFRPRLSKALLQPCADSFSHREHDQW